jgi:hypothetical protein
MGLDGYLFQHLLLGILDDELSRGSPSTRMVDTVSRGSWRAVHRNVSWIVLWLSRPLAIPSAGTASASGEARVTEADTQDPQPENPRKMQFGISTMLLAVLVAATGCMGWKLADWMVNSTDEAGFLFLPIVILSMLLLVLIAGIGGRIIVLPALVGLLANALLIPVCVRISLDGVWDMFFFLLVCNPGALFLASLRFAFVRKNDFDIGIVLLLAGAFLESWFLALAILD